MTDKKLQIASVFAVLVPAIVVLCVWQNWIPCPILDHNADAFMLYCLELLQVLFIFLIPISLKFMSIERIKTQIKGNESLYFRYALLRLTVVETVMAFGAFGYLLFQDTTFSFSFGVGLITMMYIWPTIERREREMGVESESKQSNA